MKIAVRSLKLSFMHAIVWFQRVLCISVYLVSAICFVFRTETCHLHGRIASTKLCEMTIQGARSGTCQCTCRCCKIRFYLGVWLYLCMTKGLSSMLDCFHGHLCAPWLTIWKIVLHVLLSHLRVDIIRLATSLDLLLKLLSVLGPQFRPWRDSIWFIQAGVRLLSWGYVLTWTWVSLCHISIDYFSL